MNWLKSTKPKLITVKNIYTALNQTELVDNLADNILIKIKVYQGKYRIATKAIIDFGVTKYFIDRPFCIQHLFPIRELIYTRNIYIIDVKSSIVGAVTKIRIIAMDIGSHHEQI